MAAVKTEIIYRGHLEPRTWKRYADDVFSLFERKKEGVNTFIELVNSYHPSIKFTAEIFWIHLSIRMNDLRWLKTVSSTFQDVDFDGS